MKGYIFDYGGTIDTAGCHWARVIWHSYKHCGVPVNWEQFREAYIYAERRLGSHHIIQPEFTFRETLDAKLGIEMEHLEERGFWYASHLEFNSLHAQVLDHIYARVKTETARSRETLLRLKERFPMVLVSNFYGNMSVVLAEFGLDGIFKSIIESAVVGIRKPDARLFALGVEALGMAASDVTVVGDSMEKDIKPAKSIGCHTVWVKGEGWDDAPVDESAADRIVGSVAELID